MNFPQLAKPCEDQWLDYHFDGLGRNYDIGPDGRFLMIKEQLASTAEVVLIRACPQWTCGPRNFMEISGLSLGRAA